ncbi:MAG: hypothetical protein OWT27_05285, partial [Firmicutes bacterium]|nr:hypothetical protein [Bacillota bacterium]
RVELAVHMDHFRVVLGLDAGWQMVECEATWSRDAATGAYEMRPAQVSPASAQCEVKVVLQAVPVPSGV